MLQIAQYQDGRLELQEVPRPVPPPGGVLVRVTHSVISAGTEKMKVEQARMNLLQKARARPDQVRKVLDTARNLGWKSALEKVRNRLATPSPLGYSAAGIVEAVDPGQTRLRVGDRVACGGAECAFHAEYIAVPDLLTARVPDLVENWQAAYTTIASIALQTVRQLEPRLGDRVLVIGQGLVGLLVTNLLAANGCRVLALDLAENRRTVALAVGAESFVTPGNPESRRRNPRLDRRASGSTRRSSPPPPPATAPPNRPSTRCATGAGSWWSATRTSNCPGKPPTRRSSRSATRAATAPAATIPPTNTAAPITRSATSGGPSNATSTPAST
jgi:threonine dehydrogenase-like Zn-dependent dehydrogenase